MVANPLKQSSNRINLLGIIVGLVCLLLPTPYATIIGPIIIFVCGTLLIWEMPWVVEYNGRRVFLIVLLALGCVWLGYVSRPPKPDLELRLTNATSRPQYDLLMASLYNRSDVLADKVSYAFELLNVNGLERALASLTPEQRVLSPSSNEIEKIMSASVVRSDSFRVPDQWIKDNSTIELVGINAAPQFFDAQQIGDKLIGTAVISCANCSRERGYWIFYEVGKGGWFAETADRSKPTLHEIFSSDERQKLVSQTESYLNTKRLLAKTPI